MSRMLVFLVIAFLAVCSTSPAGVYVTKDGNVGASWGGYSASAGLGGIVSENGGVKGGLHAEAGTPQHFAAAGLGGSVADGNTNGGLYSVAGNAPQQVGASSVASASSSSSSSSSSSGAVVAGGHKKPGGSFFDDIFNIPISVLGSVNQYLNNRHAAGHVKRVGPHRRVAVVPVPVAVEPLPVVVEPVPLPPSAFASASASASASSFGGPQPSHNTIPHGGATKFDDIFNIPVSALRSVNKLLNG